MVFLPEVETSKWYSWAVYHVILCLKLQICYYVNNMNSFIAWFLYITISTCVPDCPGIFVFRTTSLSRRQNLGGKQKDFPLTQYLDYEYKIMIIKHIQKKIYTTNTLFLSVAMTSDCWIFSSFRKFISRFKLLICWSANSNKFAT